MQIIQMVWNGIGGLGAGTVLLKGLFILVLGGMFWVLCELIKFVINVFSRLAGDGMRYLAVVVRGWPKEGEDAGRGKDTAPLYRTGR